MLLDPTDSAKDTSQTNTKNPRITVTTEGPEQWAVLARNLLAAKKVRNELEVGGLDCGSIEERSKGFLFFVDGSSATNNPHG